jgi:RNA polymerase sigma-70 factor (ECF subfamily)
MPDPQVEARIDAALVARALHGETAAFGQLVRRHQGAVRAHLRRLTRGDHAWADDLAQEALLRAWRSLHQFRGDARFSTWVYRIAFTLFLKDAKKCKVGPIVVPKQTESPDDGPDRHALREDMLAALDRLSEGERMALLHCYHSDLSHDEAASVLGLPVGTVKTHILRGKAKLKDWLGAWNPANGS